MAGVLYLVMAITGAYGLLIMPSNIIVEGDIASTAQNIMNQEMLFRTGILGQLICQVTFVYLVVVLARLFKGINETWSAQIKALVIASVPISFLAVVNQLAIINVLSDADITTPFEPIQLNGITALLLHSFQHVIMLASVFWGLWLIPFGLLAYRSQFIPKIFGILLVIGGIGYVVSSTVYLLAPEHSAIIDTIATAPSGIAEFGIILWLLTKGVRNAN